MKKLCKRCGIQKDISEFYKHPQMKDGCLNICISCKLLEASEFRKTNIEKVREYDRERGRSEKRKKRNKLYHERIKAEYPERYKQMRMEATEKSNRKYKEKRLARIIVGKAIRDGQLLRPSFCEICGSNEKLEAHHCDYSKPLDVTWVCTNCHKQIHVEMREIARNMA